jgi:GT2 family glycosyltransferase
MTLPEANRARVTVDGKFFRLGDTKFAVKGVTYGPFAPNARGLHFAPPEQTAEDFRLIQQLGANVVRVYDVPPRWMLDLAEGNGLRLVVGIPWNQHLCFLDSKEMREEARRAVQEAVAACGRHPAVLAFCVGNEIAPDLVRWSGTRAVERFLAELAVAARRIDPGCLCTYANFPPTEFLRPQAMDFVMFNVYLHEQPAFEKYLDRLQMMAESKPLVLGEFGIDTLREGEARQARILDWALASSFRGGLAGAVVFSFTDDWFRNGQQVEDWKMGLTTAARQPRPAFEAVQRQFRLGPHFEPARTPRVSVVVASYNGARTLRPCLESLERLNYPDYEVILVDDGSTDDTAAIVKPRPDGSGVFPHLRVIRHEQNAGLSVARNTGIAAATGELVAFTDSDCRADEDWLRYLVSDLLRSGFAGMGGPNLLPPDDSAVAAAVMASPGGPAHVMLNDREAEHIPGCNMIFHKSVLDALGGFDPLFNRAGDDVDLCWRLQQAGFKLGFSPSALVWHYRRSTVLAYLHQQEGYGEAEALLVRKHPEYFNSFGGSLWQGRIYSSSKAGVVLRRSIIYRGTFGSGSFQTLYASTPASTLMFTTTLEYYVLVVMPLWVLSTSWRVLLPMAVTALLLPMALCALAGAQATIPPAKSRWWSRPLVALLFLVQPVVRGWARYQGRFTLSARAGAEHSLDSLALRGSRASLNEVSYWSEKPVERTDLVAEMMQRLERQGWPNKSDIGWSEFDVELFGSRWSSVHLITALEAHGGKRRLFRCRLRARWSLLSHTVFWGALTLVLLAIGLWREGQPWTWLMLLLMPVLAWLLRRGQRDLQSRVAALLDQMARDLGLTRLDPDEPTPRARQRIRVKLDSPAHPETPPLAGSGETA